MSRPGKRFERPGPDTHGFIDRQSAGIALARVLLSLKLPEPICVLGLPRGGVPVAYEVARTLGAKLDVMVVRKICAPCEPEVAIGAIAPGGIVEPQPAAEPLLQAFEVTFAQLARAEHKELEQRERVYHASAPSLSLAGHTVILVDEGLATGCRMLAAERAARRAGATRVVAAAPIASHDAAMRVRPEVDDLVILETVQQLFAIGDSYAHLPPVDDAEILALLERARQEPVRAGGNAPLPHSPRASSCAARA
ncbi:MAG: phosphoribosyltransferase family protein [Pseudomonadota bacterium]